MRSQMCLGSHGLNTPELRWNQFWPQKTKGHKGGHDDTYNFCVLFRTMVLETTPHPPSLSPAHSWWNSFFWSAVRTASWGLKVDVENKNKKIKIKCWRLKECVQLYNHFLWYRCCCGGLWQQQFLHSSTGHQGNQKNSFDLWGWGTDDVIIWPLD